MTYLFFPDKTNGPLILRFHTNENVTGHGFRLDYMLTCYSGAGSVTSPSIPALPEAVTRIPLPV